jgi:GH15 family glucan-1,4-alpha-glucosidase
MTPDVAPQDLELGVIGNCEVAALIDAWGRIVWACLPRLDGDPVFCGLLQRDAGSSESGVFAIDVRNFSHAEQHYWPNTAILETVLHDSEGGALRIVDFCPRFRARGRFFRPRMFMRLIEAAAGRPRVTLRLRPLCNYGASEPQRNEGSHHVTYDTGDYRFRVTTDGSIAALRGGVSTVIDRPIALIIGPDETVDQAPMGLVRHFLESTRTYWQEWVRGLSIPVDWQSQVIRAAISLKLCTYEDTGAVLAALTTSIPEHANSGRNWDYRYSWIRDSYFVVRALNRLGATQTMENYLHFIDQVVTTGDAHGDGHGLQPLFGIGGDFALTEREIDSLPGYRSMGPVRVGNLAYVQRQHDVYGAAILACTQLFVDERLVNRGDHHLFKRLEKFGDAAARLAEQPDAGPWEFRGSEQIHTFSAAMSWAGCDRLARIATWLGLGERAAHWEQHAQSLRSMILERAWNPQVRAFTSSFGGADLDATAMLLPELGLLSATDERFSATISAIERVLKDGDWMFRYRHADDFGRPRTAFTVCGFWYVDALAALGRRDEARDQFERMLGARTRLGLLSEDIDPRTSELWGNFPQTYSLVGIINSAMRLSRQWDEVL